ncbi:MAG: hypothetical protein WBZ36_13870 [Candidatus Nitrosopolaris sp.]
MFQIDCPRTRKRSNSLSCIVNTQRRRSFGGGDAVGSKDKSIIEFSYGHVGSDVITYHGSITKKGSKYLRWIMLECAHVLIRTNKNSNITQFYTRLAKIIGSSKAAVAAASKLLKIVYWVMKEKRNTIITVKESYHVFRIEKKSLEDSLNK